MSALGDLRQLIEIGEKGVRQVALRAWLKRYVSEHQIEIQVDVEPNSILGPDELMLRAEASLAQEMAKGLPFTKKVRGTDDGSRRWINLRIRVLKED